MKYKVILLVQLLLLCLPWQLHAADNASFSAVNILVTGQSKEVRDEAFQRGLDEMFIRIAGDRSAIDKLQRPENSRAYVQRFSYEPLKKEVINTAGESLKLKLKIRYNSELIGKYLRDNGLSVWSTRRSHVVVWLIVRDGKREYVLKRSDNSQIKTSLTEALTRRGIPHYWPVYDQDDKDLVTAVDIRGGFKGPLFSASQRYSRGPVLSGSLSWSGGQWQSSWDLIMGSSDHHWNESGKSHRRVVNKIVDQAADEMSAVYAGQSRSESKAQTNVQISIEGINSISKFNTIQKYLNGLAIVKGVAPLQTIGEKAFFEVILHSNEAAFLLLINNDGKLVEVKTKIEDTPRTIVGNPYIQGEKLEVDEVRISEVNIDGSQMNQVKNDRGLVNNIQASDAVLKGVEISQDPSNVDATQQRVYHYKLVN